MARAFTKDIANYMMLGDNAIGPLLDGAAVFSFHLLVNLTTKESLGTQGDDILIVNMNNSTVGLNIILTGTALSTTIRMGARSVSTDAAALTVDSTTTLSTGVEYSIGGVVNIGGDSMRIYVDGAEEASSAAVFGAATYTHGTSNSSRNDAIGCATVTTAPISTARQTNGLVSEVAFWRADITTACFVSLSKRFSAPLIRPASLIFYMPLIGRNSPERCIKSGASGTITGTVAAGAHPRIIYPRRRL